MMRIDFTMSGMNFLLFFGIALVLQSVCILVLQNPLKKWSHFVVKDFIIFGFSLLMLVGGIVATVFGVINAVPFMI